MLPILKLHIVIYSLGLRDVIVFVEFIKLESYKNKAFTIII